MRFFKLKISWLNSLSILLIMVALGLWFRVPWADYSLADEDESGSSTTTTSVANYTPCAEDIIGIVKDQEGELIAYISDKFQEEKFNSEIIADVNEEFQDTFNWINEKKAEKMSITCKESEEEFNCEMPQDYTIESYIAEVNTCDFLIDQHKKTVEALIASQNTKTASAKSSYILVRKLQEINEGLREMNRSFGEVYAGFKTLSDNLPGVTK
ncbi:hypothetical protein HN748_04365 [Candidatus Peregrinibacteria bacterium]|jgi:hypothetical protein|nr:hypothetical protein [Candidatus Peregrinibacteria bacterium]MBT7483961.1 hypothetical protein [Candidatus Peregrinibacteria bacterium]MBT7703444.1 hypothetical protein [Candidatus Peregrinibacteria bacterium]